jgi:hypothetical protein
LLLLVHLKANKNFKQDKIQLAFCSLRSPILANYILPLKWALAHYLARRAICNQSRIHYFISQRT